VGLPLAVAFAEAGLSVVGVNNDLHKVAALNAGESYVGDVPAESLRRPCSTPGGCTPQKTTRL